MARETNQLRSQIPRGFDDTSEPAPWKRLEDRQQDRVVKRRAVLRTAAQLFLERGSHRVSMNEIAEQLNITKPALYNYFSSKDEILTECFRVGNAVAQEDFKVVEAEGGSGLEKLRNFIRIYAEVYTFDYGACMIRLDDRELPEKERTEVRGYKRAIDRQVRGLIQEGIKDGSIIDCDVRLTTFAILGALNWIGQWFQPDGEHTPAEIGAEFSIRLTNGISLENARK